jgi:hypothetical protein
MRFAAIAILLVGSCWAASNDSAAGFEAILPVLHSPRCMACHSAGDFPRQGNDLHAHLMDVRRGPAGDGAGPVHCDSCHQERNSPGLHAPPGAPGWHLPSPSMPMIWEGLNARQLCESIKDPARNGHKSIQQIVEHMQTPLVRWGWAPGEGREPVPVPFAEFLAKVRQWAAGGAACPAERAAKAVRMRISLRHG